MLEAILWTLLFLTQPIQSKDSADDFYDPIPGAKKYQYPGLDTWWVHCGRGDNDYHNRTMECARIVVPMDQFNPSASKGKTFSIPVARLLSQHKNAPTLILNNGGPGLSGLDYLFLDADEATHLFPDIDVGLSILAMDMRGVTESTPRATCYPNFKAQQESYDNYIAWPRYEQQSGLLLAYAEAFGHACRDHMGEHGAYINTPQAAADMLTVLDKIGQKNLIYYGWSYGTVLGQTFAEMYPDRVYRMVLDGVWDAESYYGPIAGQTSRVSSLDQAFTNFADKCMQEASNCTMAHGYSSASALQKDLIQKINALRERPLPAYVNSTRYGTLDFWDMAIGIWEAMYDPADWLDLGQGLSQFLKGNYTYVFDQFASIPGGFDIEDAMVDQAYQFYIYNDATRLPSNLSSEARLSTAVRDSRKWSSASWLAGDTYAQYVFKDAAWQIPVQHNFVPQAKVKLNEPILFLSVVTDPITPLVQAQIAHKVFEGSGLLVQNSTGHTTSGKLERCTAVHLWQYLYGNRLPPPGTVCQETKPYFVTDMPWLAGPTKISSDLKGANITQSGTASSGSTLEIQMTIAYNAYEEHKRKSPRTVTRRGRAPKRGRKRGI